MNKPENTDKMEKPMQPSEVILRDRDAMPKSVSLAMSYVPFQMWSDDLFDMEEALDKGTIFPELYKPFLGGRSVRKNER